MKFINFKNQHNIRDSYGFGGCVSHENDFSFILNSLGIKNINLSISGSSIIVQTAIFLEYAKNNIDYNEVYLSKLGK